MHPGQVTPRLLIVDDHEGFRSIARSLLASEGFDVAGEVGDGESAVEAVEELHPDVVLLDVHLPGIDGFEVARRLAALDDAPAVVLTSTRGKGTYQDRLANCPVRGFIAKDNLSGASLTALLPE
jgi:CheY-like chemotaxis protein